MVVTLYTTHCPKCHVLATKLDSAAIEYKVFEDVEAMSEKGIMSVPTLEIDGKMLNFKEAVDWINGGGAPLS